jgi:LacI family transcriptional regulator, galactose operon repressor
MNRPTIPDLAKAAGVSVATVNRVLGGKSSVRPATMQRVLEAAEEIGFYGARSIQGRVAAARPRYRFSVLLLQRARVFYQSIASALEAAAAAVPDSDVHLRIEYLDNLAPDYVSSRMMELGSESDCLAVVTSEHPLIADAIDALAERNVPVFALISPLSAKSNVGFVGLDNWKVGRTAAWAFERICKSPGKIGILVGNHRYRCQELNESGFRSYFREHGEGFTLLEPLFTFESSAIAREMTERLLTEHDDLCGLFISGGGITGAIPALRDSGRGHDIAAVGYELLDATKAALLDGTLDLVIAHRIDAVAHGAIAGMIRAASAGTERGSQTILLPFDIYTSENL